MSPSDRIELMELQPLVANWVLRAASLFAWCMLGCAVALMGASLFAAQEQERLWAVLPGGQTVEVAALRDVATIEAAKDHLEQLEHSAAQSAQAAQAVHR